jgi:4-hydroxybenzoate polyprenyltransferase
MNSFQTFWIAACAIAMVQVSHTVLSGSSYWGGYEAALCCGTAFGYHFAHRNQWLRAAAWALGALGVLAFVHAEVNVAPTLLLPPAAVWLAYYGFFLPNTKGFRDITFTKPLAVSFVWAWATVALPYAHAPSPGMAWLFAGRFCFIFALALAYDSSDSDKDGRTGLHTLARSLGQSGTIQAIWASLLLASGCALGGMATGAVPSGKTVGLLVSLLGSGFWAAFLLKKNKWPRWHKALIDAAMAVQWLLVWLF